MERDIGKLHSEVSYSNPGINQSSWFSTNAAASTSAVALPVSTPKNDDRKSLKRIEYKYFLQTGIFSQGEKVYFPYRGQKYLAQIAAIDLSKETAFKVIPQQPIPNLTNASNGLWVSEAALIPLNSFNGFILDNVEPEMLNRVDRLAPKISRYCAKNQQFVTNTMWSQKQIHVTFVNK